MKRKSFRRILSAALTLCMVLALLPTSALAETVTTTPGNTSLDVEYFTSTLYNWDEDKANAATAEADKTDSSTVSYTSASVSYNQQSNYSTYTSGSYYVLVNGEYYVVTNISCTRSGRQNNYTYSWTVTYSGGTVTGTNSTFTLYQQSTGTTSYEGKGFYFTNGSNRQSTPIFSQWLDSAQNYMIYSGLAASKLSESSNAPFNDDTVNAANLFATDGSNDDYADVYTNVGVPFVYDSETGYYTLDSDLYAVYFDGGSTAAASDTNLTIADKPAAHSYTEISGYSYATGFLPFDDVSTTTRTAVKSGGSSAGSTTGYQTSSTTWGFGMVTSVDFQMTDDGKDANGDAITFEFSGDDDVWVYIDGVLVLDIGGTHDAITGTIDFSTGEVELTAGSYGQIGDLSGKTSTSSVTTSETLSQTNVYTALGTTLTGFASQGSHTLTIYYMERGRGRSNCLIKFNLPQKDSVSVTKTIDEYYTNSEYEISDDVMKTLNNMDFTFTLYNGNSVVANKSYSLYDSDGNLVGTGSTDAAGTFTIKNGQTATFKNISLDEESSYYVVETSPGDRWTAKWTATSSVSNATISGGSGLTSDTVTVTGSSTATDTISFVCENSYSYGSVQPDVDTNDDTIVLDYGLPVEVNVRANDNITAYGVAVSSTMALVGADESGKVTGTYGYATINDDGNIVYTMTKQLTGIETFQYTVTASAYNTDTKQDETQSSTATLTIIPATLMYYEENFGDSSMVTYSDSNVKWVSTGTTATGYQETGFVGTTTDSTYGTDVVYLEETGDSYGTSMYADVSGNYGAAFEYDFTGTGTAILSRISTDSAYIQVTITHKDENGNTVQDDRQYVDTRVVENVSDNKTLYNIPVYNIDSLDYGTYHVYVYVYKANTTVYATYDDDGKQLTDTKSGGAFYLDGIRVYQPMGTEDNGVTGYSTAASAYATDGEANVSIINIRAKIVADDEEGWSGEEFATLTDVDGNIIKVGTYTAIGPNEELYLTKDQTVSFTLVNWDSQSYKLYLGLKAPSGSEATVAIGSATLTIKNSTVCYYDISDYVTVETYDLDEDGTEETYVGTLTITGGSNLIALTNIKVTGIDAFELGYSEDVTVVSEDDGSSSVSLTSLDADTLYLLPSTISLTMDDGSNEEEATVFTPETIKIACNWASKTKKATVTVATSTEVARVTIDGVDVTSKTSGGQLNWSKSYTKVTKGTEYEIVVYDADGNASETYTVTAE
ncbi:MAG: fibro-slime domain-containing protein [Clostridiales bacterium]|nr:fibro-slime domain-containing protein [Clostridiales bacterium]